jgi:hypothetical protein
MAPSPKKRRASAPSAGNKGTASSSASASTKSNKRTSSSSAVASASASSNKRPATSKVARQLTAAQLAAAEKERRLANAVQGNIHFTNVSKYRPGLKILLPDSIYASPSVVRCTCCSFPFLHFSILTPLFSPFSSAGT